MSSEERTSGAGSMDRRRFLFSGATVAGAAALGVSDVLGHEVPRGELDPVVRRALGKRANVETSLIGAGTGMVGGNRESNMTRLGKEKFEALLRHEWDRGIRYFDCADLYGTHPYIASAFRDRNREDYQIGTKIWVLGGGIPETERPDAFTVVDRFRKELDTDYIDLVQIHCMYDEKWPEVQAKYMEDLETLRSRGVIRAHGVSIHSLGALRACLDNDWVDAIHIRINAFGDNMDGKPEEVVEVLKKVHDQGVGVIGMKLNGEGKYRNLPEKRDASIRFVLDTNAVDVMIVGFEKPEEVDDFV
ncbi:MAG: aldo/keto reductase, partial [Planctomycetia bacterium]|nr:aldo/keto reductase [Planctomycetia bacterium]